MADEAIAPVDNADSAPADNAAPAAPPADKPAPSEPAPNGSEADNNSGNKEPAMVPSDRLREETEKRRQAEEELATLREQQSKPQTTQEDDDLDPEAVEIVKKSAKKLGFVTQEELAQKEVEIQVRQDVRDLETNPPNPGIPYNHKDVLEYAKDNNLPVTSKAALRAAYRDMNYDKIVEAERQKAIDGFKTAGTSGAEKPGSSGAAPPSEQEISGSDPKERVRERIRLARQKAQV